MSVDVFFQDFIAGESAGRDGAQMREVLAPHVTENRGSSLRVQVGDGEADVCFERDDGMMANHVSGRDPWELLLRGAQAANWVILPIDGPTCLTGPGQREELPDGLDDDVVYVDAGRGPSRGRGIGLTAASPGWPPAHATRLRAHLTPQDREEWIGRMTAEGRDQGDFWPRVRCSR